MFQRSTALRHVSQVLLGYTGLYLAYFAPALLTGRVLAPADGAIFHAAAYLAPRTLWAPMLDSGYPRFADPQYQTFFPLGLLFPHSVGWFNAFLISAYILASSFAYGYVYCLTRSRLAAAVGGIAFGMSGFMMGHLGHTTIVQTACWLPLILWALEELRGHYRPGWVVALAAGVSCSATAGHPQFFVYSVGLAGAYVAVLGWGAQAGTWRFFAASLGGLALGVGTGAVQLLPALELAPRSLRAEMTFEGFALFQLPPVELTRLVFPFAYGGMFLPGHDFPTPPLCTGNMAETTGYVGLLPLLLAVAALGYHYRARVAWFWLGVVVLCVALALGDLTPLTRFFFHLPGYNQFRIPPRHFFEFSFAVSALAGLGVVALARARGDSRWLRLGIASAFGLALVGGALLALWANPQARDQLTGGIPGFSLRPWGNLAIGLSFVVLALGMVSLWAWSATGRGWTALVLLVVCALDLASFGALSGWQQCGTTADNLRMPAALAKYRDQLSADKQRLFQFCCRPWGTCAEPIPLAAPANLNSVWQLPSVTGYNQMALSRYAPLLRTLNHLSPTWRGLDILAARYILVPSCFDGIPAAKEVEGFQWSLLNVSWPLHAGLPAGSPTERAFDWPGARATHLGLVTTLTGAGDVPDGTPVLEILVETTAGETRQYYFRVGRHVTEHYWDYLQVRGITPHQRGTVYDSSDRTDEQGRHFAAHNFLGILDLEGTLEVTRVRLRWVGPSRAGLWVHKASLKDAATGVSHQSLNPNWRLVEKFGPTVLYENPRAMPRAWLAARTLCLKSEQIMDGICGLPLPDGTAFDPAEVALVETAVPLHTSCPDPHRTVRFVRDRATEVALETQAATDSFLVLADTDYPGWRAYVDGRLAAIHRTDYALRGVLVPAGKHRVRFVFRPTSFFVGSGVSLASVCCLGILAWLSRRRRPGFLRHPGALHGSRSDELSCCGSLQGPNTAAQFPLTGS